MQKRDELLEVFLMNFGISFTSSSKCFPLALCVATDPETPSEILEHLARTDNETLLERIAEHPNTRPFLLEILASNNCPDVRAAVAENPNVSDELLAELSRDGHPDVRYRIAENPYIKNEILNELADDTNPYVAHRARITLMRMDRPEGLLRNIMHLVSSKFVHHRAASNQ